ncbi:MAG: dolichol kinase [Thermoprotei archaeon]
MDLPAAVILTAWAAFVTYYIAKKTYDYALRRGRSNNSAVYLSRKVIHFLAGGLVAFCVPFAFHEPVVPLLIAAILSIAVYMPHRTGKLLYWFQDPENSYEVDFTIMWGLIIFLSWFIDPSFWLGVIPVLFMSWGDGITGVIRNFVYGKRVKGAYGSLGMLAVTLPIGMTLGYFGALAAVVSTAAEKWGRIDDNLLVPAISFAIILIGYLYFPALSRDLW